MRGVFDKIQHFRKKFGPVFPLAQTILKEKLSKYPHLYIYARCCRDIITGRISSGFRNLSQQLIVDWHNTRQLRKNRLAQEQLRRLHQEAILCCIRHNVFRWWAFLPNAKLNCIPSLQTFLQECVLRRAGDYREFLRIRNELKKVSSPGLTQNVFFDIFVQHFANVLDAMDAGTLTKSIPFNPAKRRFLIGFSVWGESYLHLFLNYCLPSLLAEGNLPTLCKERQPIFFIHTNPEGQRRIEQAHITQQVKALGIIFIYQMVNETLIHYFSDDPGNKYWHLGMVQSLDLYFAKTLDADFHLLVPDTIYSNQHFAAILRAARRGHKAIARLGLSTRMEGICPAVEIYRNSSGAISIPAADLTSLSVQHTHSASQGWVVTHHDMGTELPSLYMAVWEGKDTLHMLSPHQTILYLDKEIISKAPKRYFMTLDGELDKIIPPEYPVYHPKAEDGMCLVEITSEKQRPTKLLKNSAKEFSRLFWYSAQHSMTYWRFFDADIIDPLNRDIIPHRSYMSDEDISQAKALMKKGLMEHRPIVTIEQVRLALEILQEVETHPHAPAMQDQINDTAQSIQNMVEEPHKHSSAFQQIAMNWRDRHLTHKDSPTLPTVKTWRNVRTRKNLSALEKLYQEAILSCIEHRAYKWWNMLPNAKFNSVLHLQAFLRECVLRRAGDYQEFLRIKQELHHMRVSLPANETFFDNMVQHYAGLTDAMDAGVLTQDILLDPHQRRFLIGFSVWGDNYLNPFLSYCLPSLLAEGNLPRLCKERQPIFFVHTDPQGKQRIEQAEVTQRIKDLGVILIYQMVNPALVNAFGDDPSNKYWHLGMVQSLDLYFAKTLDADYHLLMPDSIYSNQHFSGLLRAASRGHPAIIRLMLSTRMEGICPAVDANYRDKNGIISVPAADLATLSVIHVHSASRPWIVTHKNTDAEASNSHVVIWEGKNTLHMLSLHQTILYLDRTITRTLRKRFFMTLDSELDKIIPQDCPIYCPQPEDAICLIEMTSEKQRPTELKAHYSIKDFCRIFWYGAQESMAYWRIFNENLIDPLRRDMLSDAHYMSDADIAHAKRVLKNALLSSYPASTPAQTQMALKILRAVESHPKADQLRTLLDETEQTIRTMENQPVQLLAA